MPDAVSEYQRHRQAPDKWALGRFVVPLARWSELEAAVHELAPPRDPWPVSLLAAPADAARIRDIANRNDSRLVVRGVECKAATVADAAQAASLVELGTDVFAELDPAGDVGAMAAQLARSGASAKIRTGGTTANAFPDTRQVLAFLHACRSARIRFKATAGLHHAVRGEYRLTYDPSPPTGTMFGFLNVAVAAALLWFGRDDETVLRALEERSLERFEFTETGLTWRDERLSLRELDEVRSAFFTGFGSCSFSEPMADLGLEAVPRP